MNSVEAGSAALVEVNVPAVAPEVLPANVTDPKAPVGSSESVQEGVKKVMATEPGEGGSADVVTTGDYKPAEPVMAVDAVKTTDTTATVGDLAGGETTTEGATVCEANEMSTPADSSDTNKGLLSSDGNAKENKGSGSTKKNTGSKEGKVAPKAKAAVGEPKARSRPKKEAIVGVAALPSVATHKPRVKGVPGDKQLLALQTQQGTLRKKLSTVQQEAQSLKSAIVSISKEAGKATPDITKIVTICNRALNANKAADDTPGTGDGSIKAQTRGRRSNTKNGKGLRSNQPKKNQNVFKSTPPTMSNAIGTRDIPIASNGLLEDQRKGSKGNDESGRQQKGQHAQVMPQKTVDGRRPNNIRQRKQQNQQISFRNAQDPRFGGIYGRQVNSVASGPLVRQQQQQLMMRQGRWTQNPHPHPEVVREKGAVYNHGPAILRSLMNPPDPVDAYRPAHNNPAVFGGFIPNNQQPGRTLFNVHSNHAGGPQGLPGPFRRPSVERLPVAESPAKSSDHPVSMRIRQQFRAAQKPEELEKIIAQAEAHKLQHEVANGKKKLASMLAQAAKQAA